MSHKWRFPVGNSLHRCWAFVALQVRAKTAGASKTFETEVDKPLGLTLGQKSGGGVIVTVSFRSGISFVLSRHAFNRSVARIRLVPAQ